MLRLKWKFGKDEKKFDQNNLKLKSTFNFREKDAVIKTYLSSLEENLMKIEIPQNKCDNLTMEQWSALYHLESTKTLL